MLGRHLTLVIAALACLGGVVGPPVRIPWSDSRDPDCKGCKEIRDENVAGVVSEISETDQRLALCFLSTTGPPQATILTYAPTVTGPHKVSTKVLRCHSYTSDLECRFESAEAYFDSNPREYFEVGEGVALSEALEIARAYASDLIAPRASWWERWLPELKLRSIARDGANFSLRVGDCGCGGTLSVSVESSDSSRRLQLLADPKLICI